MKIFALIFQLKVKEMICRNSVQPTHAARHPSQPCPPTPGADDRSSASTEPMHSHRAHRIHREIQRRFLSVPVERDQHYSIVLKTMVSVISFSSRSEGVLTSLSNPSPQVKQKEFNPKTGMEQLQVVNISRVQAIQRAGRAGRTQRGKCYRLFTDDAYRLKFQENATPEILRSNLASVCLQMKAMGIQNVREN
jgi:hypothetical protein